MSIEYIKDNNGTTTAIVIPMDEWNQITGKHKDLKQFEPRQIAE